MWQQISSEDVNTEFGSEQEAAGWKSSFNTKQNLWVGDLKNFNCKTKTKPLWTIIFPFSLRKTLRFLELGLGDKGTISNNLRQNPYNFQWTKTLYQNNLNNIAFFFYIFQGL